VGEGATGTRRAFAWAYTDIWSFQEVSSARRLTSWVALLFTVLIAAFYAMGR
jgi:hypothetical protein